MAGEVLAAKMKKLSEEKKKTLYIFGGFFGHFVGRMVVVLWLLTKLVERKKGKEKKKKITFVRWFLCIVIFPFPNVDGTISL